MAAAADQEHARAWQRQHFRHAVRALPLGEAAPPRLGDGRVREEPSRPRRAELARDQPHAPVDGPDNGRAPPRHRYGARHIAERAAVGAGHRRDRVVVARDEQPVQAAEHGRAPGRHMGDGAGAQGAQFGPLPRPVRGEALGTGRERPKPAPTGDAEHAARMRLHHGVDVPPPCRAVGIAWQRVLRHAHEATVVGQCPHAGALRIKHDDRRSGEDVGAPKIPPGLLDLDGARGGRVLDADHAEIGGACRVCAADRRRMRAEQERGGKRGASPTAGFGEH